MTVTMLRRRKLGKTSCNEISNFSHRINTVAVHGVNLRNGAMKYPIPEGTTTIIRWGCTANTGVRNTINTAEAIHRVGDKGGFRDIMMNSWNEGGRVGMPICPHTWRQDTVGEIREGDYPLVVRPRVHAQGKHVYKVNNAVELQRAIQKCGEGWYAAKFIDKVAEYRVFFMQGRAVWVANKTPGNPEDVAWNVARGGRFDNVRFDNWPLKAIRISREAFLLSGLDFGGVDVMVDAAGNAFVLEINSAPSQTSPYRQECVAKSFDYLLQHGKGNIPVIEARGGWKKFIHPAVSNEAILVG